MVDLADLRKKAKGAKGAKAQTALPGSEALSGAGAPVESSSGPEGVGSPVSVPPPAPVEERQAPTPVSEPPAELGSAPEPPAVAIPAPTLPVEAPPPVAVPKETEPPAVAISAPTLPVEAPPPVEAPTKAEPSSVPTKPDEKKVVEEEEPIILRRRVPPPAPMKMEPVAPPPLPAAKAKEPEPEPVAKAKPAETSSKPEAGRAAPATSASVPPPPPGSPEARPAGSAEPVAEAETREFLTFSLGGEEYAMPIDRIVEIVPWRPTTMVPNADETVVGILSLRGVVVTILDVRSRLGGKPMPPGPDTRFVVINLEKEMVGLFVDRVRRVVRFDPKDIEPPPRISTGEGSDSVAGVVEREGKIVILLDLERLLAGIGGVAPEVSA
jgi:purine-binding chemotaxis protein CheW